MKLRLNCLDPMQRDIDAAYQRAMDAYTIEDAIDCHSELVDLFSVAAMTVRKVSRSEVANKAILTDINAAAAHHRDAVDRLTDIVESRHRTVWQQSWVGG
jgi:hypothetical protein